MSSKSEEYGKKSAEHHNREVMSYVFKRKCGWTEEKRAAFMRGEFNPWGNWHGDGYHVICDTNRKLILRGIGNDGRIIWHPYIEKAKIFKDRNEAYEFIKNIDWKKSGLDEDMYGISDKFYPIYHTPMFISVGKVDEMTIGRTWSTPYGGNKFWPFKAQTGIKYQITK